MDFLEMKRHTLHIIALLLTFSLAINAQESGVFVNNLKSMQVKPNGEWDQPPVMLLARGQYMEITFDDLQHNFVRYTYRITHCNSDWTRSDLLVSEYMDGFEENRLEDYEQSMTTEMDYNHYRLTIPNDDVRLLVSGNYIVDIYGEDDEDEPVARACFSVVEPRVGIDISVSGNTDIDTYESHQQVSFSINYSGMQVKNPSSDFKPVVLQNRRWDNHVRDIMPTYMPINKLIYEHVNALIFDAGAEYRRFEILDRHTPTMRVDRMQYDGDYYHAILFEDELRTAYFFDHDQDGHYFVRHFDDDNNETESDYFYTHFSLKMPALPGGDVYINGELTNNRISEEYKMEYNLIDHCYEIVLPLKQGAYNYQYLFVRDGETVGHTGPCEGNFHQTENEYIIYVYYRDFGDRYDRLVGFQQIKTTL